MVFHGKPELVELGWSGVGGLIDLKRHNFMIESWRVATYFLFGCPFASPVSIMCSYIFSIKLIVFSLQ